MFSSLPQELKDLALEFFVVDDHQEFIVDLIVGQQDLTNMRHYFLDFPLFVSTISLFQWARNMLNLELGHKLAITIAKRSESFKELTDFLTLSEIEEYRPEIIEGAISGARKDILQSLEFNCAGGEDCHCAAAGESGSVEFFRWMLNEKKCFQLHSAIYYAIEQGDLDMVKEVFTTTGKALNDPTGENMSEAAISYGHLHILKWLVEIGKFRLSNRSMFLQAAVIGHLEVLKWLRYEIGCSWGPAGTLAAAVGKGGKEVIEWLLKEGCPKDERAYAEAIETGNLVAMQILYEHDVPFSLFTIARVLDPGYLVPEILMWLIDKGCPWNDGALCVVIEHDLLDIFKMMMTTHLQYSTRHIKNTLQEYSRDVIWEQGSRCLMIIDYILTEKPALWTQEVYLTAITKNDIKLLEWAIARDLPVNERACAKVALEVGATKSLLWLQKRNPKFNLRIDTWGTHAVT